MDRQEQIQRTVDIAKSSFNFLQDFALPITIGIIVTVVSGVILFLFKRKLNK